MSIEKFLIDRNVVKTKKQAEGVMIGIIAICLIFIIVNMFGGNSRPSGELTPEEIQQLRAEFGDEFGNPIEGAFDATDSEQEEL